MKRLCTEGHVEGRARKRVRIDLERNTVQEFDTPENVPPTYLSEEDYRRRRNEDHKVIAELETPMSMLPSPSPKRKSDETDDWRGLEGRTQAEKSRRRQSRHETMIAVLEEQWYQKIEGCTNVEVIAQVYRNFSSSALEEAQRRAKNDADFVQQWQSKDMDRGNDGIGYTGNTESFKTLRLRSVSPCENSSAIKKRKTTVSSLKPFVQSVLNQPPREPLLAWSVMALQYQ